MKWSDFERYLKGEHLGGKKPVVVIEEVVIEETHAGGKAEDKPVAYFVGKQKGLILSPTNQRTLRALFGDDVAACRGKSVMLEATPMRVAGRDTLPIRISPAPQPAQPAKTPPAASAPQEDGENEDLAGDQCDWDDIEKVTPYADVKPTQA